MGWVKEPEITLIDVALNEYDSDWAASGHSHSVYPTSFAELLRIFGARPMAIGSK